LDEKPFGENVKGLSPYSFAKVQTPSRGNVGVFVMARQGFRAAGIHKKMFSQVNLLAGTGESPVS
jgi:hypothetical protein